MNQEEIQALLEAQNKKKESVAHLKENFLNSIGDISDETHETITSVFNFNGQKCLLSFSKKKFVPIVYAPEEFTTGIRADYYKSRGMTAEILNEAGKLHSEKYRILRDLADHLYKESIGELEQKIQLVQINDKKETI